MIVCWKQPIQMCSLPITDKIANHGAYILKRFETKPCTNSGEIYSTHANGCCFKSCGRNSTRHCFHPTEQMVFLVICSITCIYKNHMVHAIYAFEYRRHFSRRPITPTKTHQTVNKLEKMTVQKCYYCFKPIAWCN